MGLTSTAETADVVQWVQQYPEVAAEIDAIQIGLEDYAQAYAVLPDASVKEKIFSSINREKSGQVVKLKTTDNVQANVYSISSGWKYAAAASIILLIGSVISNIVFFNKYKSVDRELASAKTELQQQKELASNMNNDMDVMTNKNAMPVSLAPMPDVPDAAARIYWMQNTKEVYIDPSNLPKAPAGKQYQFWAIVDGRPVNGGIITTEINGKKVHVQKMKSFGNAQAFAVSLEDAGTEKPVPTKVMVMGKI
jgi:anti-sigma-K factor RskA